MNEIERQIRKIIPDDTAWLWAESTKVFQYMLTLKLVAFVLLILFHLLSEGRTLKYSYYIIYDMIYNIIYGIQYNIWYII